MSEPTDPVRASASAASFDLDEMSMRAFQAAHANGPPMDPHAMVRFSQLDMDAATKPLHVEIERLRASAASTSQEECDGCVRGLMTYRRGPDYDTQRWHKDGAREFLCELPLAKWGTGGKDHVCRELHANTIRGVESAFTAKEWQAASDEMHSTGNSSWVGVVQIAVERLRAALASQPSEAESAPPAFTENEIKDVLTSLYQDGHVDLVLADRVAALMKGQGL